MHKKKTLVLVLAMVAVLLASVLGCSQPAATPAPTSAPSPAASPKTAPVASPAPTQATIKWKMQAAYPFANYYTVLFGTDYANWVKDITNGRLQIEVHPPGTFATGTDILTAVSKGTVEMSLDFGSMYPEKVPVSNVESGLPMVWATNEEVFDAFYNRGLMEVVREGYAKYNVFQLGVSTQGQYYHLGTNWEFKSLDEVKGKKIRAAGVYADYIKALGGVPTVISGSELYMALKTGVIDGLVYGAGGLKSMKLAEVLKAYVVSPTLTPLVCGGPTINKNAWDALPPDIRHLLLENTKYFQSAAAAKYKILNVADAAWAAQNYGVQLASLSPQDEAKARAASVGIWDAVAQKDPLSAKAVDIVKKQLKDWGKLQ